MKHIVMKNITLAVVMAGVSGSTLASTASNSFQWAGSVPEAPVSGEFEIFNKGTMDFTNGTMTFVESTSQAGKYEISSSSTLSFGVRSVKDQKDAASFDYEVQKVRYTAGGLMQPVNPTVPEFVIVANGQKLVEGTPVKSTVAGETINLNVKTESPTDVVKSGSDVVVMSSILVTNAAL